MQISVNGSLKDVPSEPSVTALLNWLNVVPDRVAVELNQSIVRKRDWGSTIVSAGSQIEIVEFVGGG